MIIKAKGVRNKILEILIDDDDYEEVSKKSWFVTKNGYTYCEFRSEGKLLSRVFLHRFVMMEHLLSNKKLQVDHKNNIINDCRKENLRICNNQQNTFNQKKRPTLICTSKYKGVCWCKKVKKWRAVITKDNKQHYLGTYINEKDAAFAYNQASLKLFGEFARINEI